ncbi:hypothetical protein K439DRAFT_1658968 [Ramaria rubella]|nr:hypothetical protein K439DRAFT_1658968 [Ramaria rubella]
MNQFQQQQQQTVLGRPRADSRATTDYESDLGETSTVWSQRQIASYLERDDANESTRSSVSPEVVSEEEERGSGSDDTEGVYEDDIEYDGITPSLGDLDSALVFLAAEKAKLAASHLDGRSTSHSSTGESAWRHVIEPKRKRRRKRKGPSGLPKTGEQDEGAKTTTVVPTPEGSASSPDLSSSPLQPDPELASHHRTKIQAQSPPRPHSLLTPPDPRLLRLRALVKKLRHDFPQNDSRLKQVLVDDFSEPDLIDPRGPEPQTGDALTHVFVDHSNILIGFLNHVKRSRRSASGKPLLFFPALALILERGRPISRRVLATSSPLYQNMDIAEDLGYNVHVYVRVPDLSGDAGNGLNNGNGNNNHTNSYNGGSALGIRSMKPRKPIPAVQTGAPPGLVRSATESDPGQLSPTISRSTTRTHTHSRSISATTSTSPSSSSTLALASANVSGRIRYREQGVDELLQLKLHQALVSPDADPLPTGATIVLATGDGASGQFNEDGFVGVVKTALNKGWMVELYAWAGGISNIWRKVAEEEGRGKLKIWEMDPYAGDLQEIGGVGS